MHGFNVATPKASNKKAALAKAVGAAQVAIAKADLALAQPPAPPSAELADSPLYDQLLRLHALELVEYMGKLRQLDKAVVTAERTAEKAVDSSHRSANAAAPRKLKALTPELYAEWRAEYTTCNRKEKDFTAWLAIRYRNKFKINATPRAFSNWIKKHINPK